MKFLLALALLVVLALGEECALESGGEMVCDDNQIDGNPLMDACCSCERPCACDDETNTCEPMRRRNLEEPISRLLRRNLRRDLSAGECMDDCEEACAGLSGDMSCLSCTDGCNVCSDINGNNPVPLGDECTEDVHRRSLRRSLSNDLEICITALTDPEDQAGVDCCNCQEDKRRERLDCAEEDDVQGCLDDVEACECV